MRSKRPKDPERDRRLAARQETRQALEQLQGTGASPAARARKLAPAVERTLVASGFYFAGGGDTAIGRIGPAHQGPDAPIQLQVFPLLALPKIRRVVAPTWLSVVRLMPCMPCDGKTGRPFYDQIPTRKPQSEANHHPGRGRAGGGSDLETHPVCSKCHRRITEHDRGLIYGDAACTWYVERTLLTIVRAIREGRLDPGILLAAWIEAVVGNGG